ncbi:RDD family protein [Thermomonas sp. HDW16]|uniref:RDD family protein n=1 Tax=Thermomonas sp. HDW16 TaxID=2714945 RepID=UPI001F0E0236|nr:RDD family protein [Thermomonas sp. HDW16]
MSDIERSPTLIGWRLLALAYDFFPVLALWFLTAGVFTALHGDAVRGGWLGLVEFMVFWLIAGLYAVFSWRRGGKTVGMRPWRLRVVDARGDNASSRALWLRYVIGGVSLLLGGLGFWWAWFDRDRLTWHDRASGTRMIREAR